MSPARRVKERATDDDTSIEHGQLTHGHGPASSPTWRPGARPVSQPRTELEVAPVSTLLSPSSALGTSVTGATLRSAVEGLGARGRATADNLANIQTPGFLANRVTFEAALADAVDTGSRSLTSHEVLRSLEPTREDGNNVNLDQETLISIDTQLRYQLMLRALDDRFAAVRAAMRSIG